MNPTDAWREAVSPDRPVFTGGIIERFESPVDEISYAETEFTKSPSRTGIVRISGNDAIDFVHTQFSGDCLSLTEGNSLLTSWCNPKGRVTHIIRLVHQKGTLYALVPRDQTSTFCTRLSMFILRAKVKLEDLSESHGAIVENAPNNEDGLSSKWHIQSFEMLNNVWSQINATPIGAKAMRLKDIRRGLPQLAAALSEQFLPQELNLDALGGISYEKGCYPGQEIIARVKFRGTVKRRTRRLQLGLHATLIPGDQIVDDQEKKTVGRVLYAAPTNSNKTEILAVLGIDAQDLILEKHPESPLTVECLPYNFDS